MSSHVSCDGGDQVSRDEVKSSEHDVEEAPVDPPVCTHVSTFVNHGAALDSADTRLVVLNKASQCSSCQHGYLNWVCLGCFQVCRCQERIADAGQ